MTDIELLKRAARRASTRPEFLGFVLAEYGKAHQLDEAQLAAHIGVSDETFIRLCFCLAPDAACDAREYVEAVSDAIGGDAARLAEVIAWWRRST